MFRHSVLEHSKEEEVTQRQIWTVNWGNDSIGFCHSKSCLTFSSVVRPCILQMDHNASKRLPPTLLTYIFRQIWNNRFGKEGCIIFHAFRNIKQTFNACATPNNRYEAIFGLNFLLRNFRQVICIFSLIQMMKICKNNQLSFPVNISSNPCCWSCSSIWRSSWESLTRDRFWSASNKCETQRKLNFSKCKSSWSTHKQVFLPIFSLRQSTLHEMDGNC
jgi:hypothetical protein